jgi:hypothetical protein
MAGLVYCRVLLTAGGNLYISADRPVAAAGTGMVLSGAERS